jgi:polyferredoxin
MLALVGGLMLYGLATRADFSLNVLHERSPLFVKLRDGSILNAYTIKILNKKRAETAFRLQAEGIEGTELRAVGGDEHPEHDLGLKAAPDTVTHFRVLVRAAGSKPTAASTPLRFVLRDEESGGTAAYDTIFLGPER